MALTLQQISQLETAKKTGQPQDLAALMAALMAGGVPGQGEDLLGPTNSAPFTGNQNAPVTGPAGATPTNVQALVELLSSINPSPGGDASTSGVPSSEPGPGPVTAQDVVGHPGFVDDPSGTFNTVAQQGQQNLNAMQTGQQISGFVSNPVSSLVGALANSLGITGLGKSAATLGVNTGLNQLGLNVPTNPVSMPAQIASAAFGLGANQQAGHLGQMGPAAMQAGQIAEANTTFQLQGRGLGPEANPAPEAPEASPIGIAEGLDVGDMGIPGVVSDAGPVGVQGESPQGEGMGEGPETPSGQGSAGDSGGGPGSLLADFATNGKPPKQLYDFHDQFMRAHPKDGKKLFTAYQTVAKQVIAKAKSKKEEDQLQARVYDEFIQPITRYMDDGEVQLATDTLVRTTKDLARKYSVPIPDRYEAVLKRQ